MNAQLKIDEFGINDGAITITGKIVDPTSTYSTKSVTAIIVGLHAYADVTVDGVSAVGVFTITELVASGRKNFTITLENINDIDPATLQISPAADAFICSMMGDGIDDIPSGIALGISTSLTEWARSWNIIDAMRWNKPTASSRVVTQVVKLADLAVDESAPAGQRCVIALDDKPTSDEVSIEMNGVVYNEHDADGGGDFVVDRDGQRLFLDAYDDDFSLDDWRSAADEIRIRYTVSLE